MARITHFIALLKFRVSILGLVFAMLGIYLSGNIDLLLTRPVIQALIAIPLIVLFAFVINDIVDADLDKHSKPHRPIASGNVSTHEALILAILLAGIGLLLAWTVSVPLGILATVNVLMSIAYSIWLKQTLLLGNMTTSYLNASVLIYGGLAVGDVTLVVWWVASLVFLFSLAYEVLYAVEDLEGDMLGGVMTTAHFLGQARSLWLVRLLCLIVIVISLLPFMLSVSSYAFLFAIIALCIVPIAWVIIQLKPSANDVSIRRSRTVLTFVQYLSIIPILLLYFGA